MGTWLSDSPTSKPSPSSKPSYRPRLDVLEDRLALSTVVADYDGFGLWRYTDFYGWQQLTDADPDLIAASADGSVAADFGGELWRYTDRFGWEFLTDAFATQIGVSDFGVVWGDFDSAGLWRFSDFTGWQLVTPADPLLFDVAADGHLVADFGGAVWRLSPVWGWNLLTTWTAYDLDISVGGNVVADLGGLFRFTNFTGWQLLSWDPTNYLAIGSNADVVADFSYGLDYYSIYWGWYPLTDQVVYDLGYSADGWVVVALAGGPLARYSEFGGWQVLDWDPPAQIAVG